MGPHLGPWTWAARLCPKLSPEQRLKLVEPASQHSPLPVLRARP